MRHDDIVKVSEIDNEYGASNWLAKGWVLLEVLKRHDDIIYIIGKKRES